jgi:small subunit ribosomal protein S7e
MAEMIAKPMGDNSEPTQVDLQVAQALVDLRTSYPELTQLRIVGAKEYEVGSGADKSGAKAVVVSIPFRQLAAYKKIQARVTEDLEKKFAGKHFAFVAWRRTLPAPAVNNHKKMQKRPYSRTLTAVHDAILQDLVYPSEVSGMRTRVRLDGSKFLKVSIDRKDSKAEGKTDTYSAVYKRLTGKEAHFEVVA